MGDYKHLREKDRKKLIIINKVKKALIKLGGWGILILLIFICLIAGIIAFYIYVDNKYGYSENSEEQKLYSKDKADNRDLDVYFEKDLENAVADRQENAEDMKVTGEGNTDSTSEVQIEKMYDFSEWNKACPKELIVVNSKNPLPECYKVDTKLCRGKEVNLVAIDSLESMIENARKEGMVLWISSAYRTIQYQTKLFNRQVEEEISGGKSLAEAKKSVSEVLAEPGRSEHNAGLAIDFNGVKDDFYKTKEYKWLMDNAHKYGFIERYQKKWYEKTGVLYEPWHFRYVGVEYAERIKESNLCLEEYIKQNLM